VKSADPAEEKKFHPGAHSRDIRILFISKCGCFYTVNKSKNIKKPNSNNFFFKSIEGKKNLKI